MQVQITLGAWKYTIVCSVLSVVSVTVDKLITKKNPLHYSSKLTGWWSRFAVHLSQDFTILNLSHLIGCSDWWLMFFIMFHMHVGTLPWNKSWLSFKCLFIYHLSHSVITFAVQTTSFNNLTVSFSAPKSSRRESSGSKDDPWLLHPVSCDK
jgi:hypothetical protein